MVRKRPAEKRTAVHGRRHGRPAEPCRPGRPTESHSRFLSNKNARKRVIRLHIARLRYGVWRQSSAGLRSEVHEATSPSRPYHRRGAPTADLEQPPADSHRILSRLAAEDASRSGSDRTPPASSEAMWVRDWSSKQAECVCESESGRNIALCPHNTGILAMPIAAPHGACSVPRAAGAMLVSRGPRALRELRSATRSEKPRDARRLDLVVRPCGCPESQATRLEASKLAHARAWFEDRRVNAEMQRAQVVTAAWVAAPARDMTLVRRASEGSWRSAAVHRTARWWMGTTGPLTPQLRLEAGSSGTHGA